MDFAVSFYLYLCQLYYLKMIHHEKNDIVIPVTYPYYGNGNDVAYGKGI